MKKLFSLLLISSIMLAFAGKTSAQIVEPLKATTTSTGSTVKYTMTNADSAFVNFGVSSELRSVTVYDTKFSGTVAGKWLLRGTVETVINNNTRWDRLDSLVRGDGDNRKTFTIPNPTILPYAKYQLVLSQTGTAVSYVYPIPVSVRRTSN